MSSNYAPNEPDATAAPPSTAVAPTSSVVSLVASDAVRPPSSYVEAYKDSDLQFSLAAPSADSVTDALSTCDAWGETGKLNHFPNPRTTPIFLCTRSNPKPEGLFSRIKTADRRDGWKAEVHWNIGQNCEKSLAGSHKVADALIFSNLATYTESFSFLNHFLQDT